MQPILICGSGTAGWMTALYLSHLYNRVEHRVDIQLIESSAQPPVGVGEATVHGIRHFLQLLSINEAEFMQATDATFKLGIEFINWKKAHNGQMHRYWHPFDFQTPEVNGMDLAHCWLSQTHKMQDYAHSVSISPFLAKRGKAPKFAEMADYQAPIPYAYHFDAGKLAEYLKKLAVQRGVKHQVADITQVQISEGTADKKITGIDTSVGRLTADMYFDYTGFRAMLMQALQSDNQDNAESSWVDWSSELPCDRALAVQTQYPQGQDPALHTQAIAMQNGWRWGIGLQNRIGNGYVYSSQFCTEEQAADELSQALNLPDNTEFKSLKMRIGHRKQSWLGNCCAIGLSSGFIEPLESTGIYLIEAGLRLFGEYAQSGNLPLMQQHYNRILNDIYADLKSFIVLHYILSDRDDSEFWRFWQTQRYSDPQLAAWLQLWQHKVIESSDFLAQKSALFNQINYRFVVYGMGYLPQQPFVGVNPPAQQQLLSQMAAFCQQQPDRHPSQVQLLGL